MNSLVSIMSMVSATGTLVNRLSISKLIIILRSLSIRCRISLENENTSDTVYSDMASGASSGTRNLAHL